MFEDEKRAKLSAAAMDVVVKLQAEGYEAFFVGGCVRDFLRGVEPGDYDIVTSALPEEVQKLFPHTVPVGAKFGVVLVIDDGGRRYEVATYRTEAGYDDGRRPSQVQFATAREDVLRRDFTVNGLLLDPLTGYVFDLVGGHMDISRIRSNASLRTACACCGPSVSLQPSILKSIRTRLPPSAVMPRRSGKSARSGSGMS
jgi:tRNA nucleotidyltransferase/poly(A) polymerase